MNFILLEHEVPREFLKVAARLEVEPDHLAKVICENFAWNPPAALVIISRLPEPARQAGVDSVSLPKPMA